MDDAKPHMEPGGRRRSSSRYEVPSQLPSPSMDMTATEEMMPPPPLTAAMGQTTPELPMTAGAAAGVSAWQNNKKLTAIWCINQNRNSWVGVDGIGWKKLANTNDSSSVALTMLSAHAREKSSVVNYREEADGMIYEVYVW